MISAVELKPGEAVGFWLLARLFFLLGFGMALGGTGGEALFVRVVGVGELPRFFVASDVAIATGALMLALGAGRVGAATPFRVLLPFGLVGVACLAPLLARGVAGAVFGAYLLFQAVSILVMVHLARYLGLYLDIGQAKRQLPALYGISSVGRIVGGLAVPVAVGWVGNVGLLGFWGVCCVLELLVLVAFDRRVKPLPGAAGSRDQEGELLPLVRRYPLFGWVLVFTGVSTILFRVMDVHANRLLAAQYTSGEALASFYGTFGAAGSLVGALLGAFGTPWLLGRVGVAFALAVVPLVAGGAAVGLAVAPGLAAAIAGRGCAQVLRGSMLNPTLDIMQSALPPRLISAAILVTSGVVIPGATIVVYLLLTALGTGASDRQLGGVQAAGALGLVLLVPVLARAYAHVLLRVLEARQLSTLRAQAHSAIELPDAAVADLLGRVHDRDPVGAELAAELLAAAGSAGVVEPLREALGACRSPRVARALLRHPLVLVEPLDAVPLVRALGADGTPESVRTLAVVAEHAAGRGGGWLPLLEQLAGHADAGVRAAALVGVGRRRDIGEAQRAALVADLEAGDEGRARAALRACAALGIGAAVAPAVRLLGRRSLAGAALEALAVLDLEPDAARLAAYDRALGSAGPGGREAACTLLERGGSMQAIEVFVRLLGRNQPSVVERAKAFLSLQFEAALPRVEQELVDPRSSYAARREAVDLMAHWHQHERLETAAAAWTAQAYTAVERLVLAGEVAGGQTPVREFLVAVLEQRARECFALAAETHLHRCHPGGRATVMDGLRSADRGLRARALEALGAALPAEARAACARGFEEVDHADLTAHGRSLGLLPPIGASPLSALESMARAPDPFLAAAAARMLDQLGRPLPSGVIPVPWKTVTGGIMKTLDRLIFLKSVELFRDFAVEDLSLIADVAREVELQADQVLFREGEPADRLWLLVDGNVTLYSDKDGGFHLITVLSARDAAGDVALFDGGVHPASGRVEQAGMALAIERDDLMALVRDYPSLAVAFLTQLAQTVRRFQGRIALMEDAMVQMGREAGGR